MPARVQRALSVSTPGCACLWCAAESSTLLVTGFSVQLGMPGLLPVTIGGSEFGFPPGVVWGPGPDTGGGAVPVTACPISSPATHRVPVVHEIAVMALRSIAAGALHAGAA